MYEGLMMKWQGRQVKFAWIPLHLLKVDDKYQRDLSDAHVKKLAEEFNPLRFYPMVVNLRIDGSYWIIEGQHRKQGLFDRFGPSCLVPCMVWIHLTLAEEADGWLGNSGIRRTTPLQVHKTSLVSGTDPLAQEVSDILAVRGMDVRGSSATSIKGVETLRKIVKVHGGDTLGFTIDYLKEVYGAKADTWSAPLMEAIARLHTDYPTIQWHRVMNVLHEWGHPGGLTANPPTGQALYKNSQNYMNSEHEPGSAAHKVEKFIIIKYNKKLRPNSPTKLPEPESWKHK